MSAEDNNLFRKARKADAPEPSPQGEAAWTAESADAAHERHVRQSAEARRRVAAGQRASDRADAPEPSPQGAPADRPFAAEGAWLAGETPEPYAPDERPEAAAQQPDPDPEPQLVVVAPPDKVKYRPGEKVNFKGLFVTYGGEDVSNAVLTSLEEGTAWRAEDKKVEVELAYTDAQGDVHRGVYFTLKRKRRLLFLLFIFLLVAAIAGAAAYFAYQAYLDSLPKPDVGSHIIPQGDMSDDDLRKLLNEQAEKSRFTVSVRPTPELYDGQLRMNFMVETPNNGLSERLEVEQGGNIIASTGIVEPGYMIEWVPAPQAVVGPATATVYAVDENGQDSGNPASVEIEIIEGATGPSQ